MSSIIRNLLFDKAIRNVLVERARVDVPQQATAVGGGVARDTLPTYFVDMNSFLFCPNATPLAGTAPSPIATLERAFRGIAARLPQANFELFVSGDDFCSVAASYPPMVALHTLFAIVRVVAGQNIKGLRVNPCSGPAWAAAVSALLRSDQKSPSAACHRKILCSANTAACTAGVECCLNLEAFLAETSVMELEIFSPGMLLSMFPNFSAPSNLLIIHAIELQHGVLLHLPWMSKRRSDENDGVSPAHLAIHELEFMGACVGKMPTVSVCEASHLLTRWALLPSEGRQKELNARKLAAEINQHLQLLRSGASFSAAGMGLLLDAVQRMQIAPWIVSLLKHTEWPSPTPSNTLAWTLLSPLRGAILHAIIDMQRQKDVISIDWPLGNSQITQSDQFSLDSKLESVRLNQFWPRRTNSISDPAAKVSASSTKGSGLGREQLIPRLACVFSQRYSADASMCVGLSMPFMEHVESMLATSSSQSQPLHRANACALALLLGSGILRDWQNCVLVSVILALSPDAFESKMKCSAHGLREAYSTYLVFLEHIIWLNEVYNGELFPVLKLNGALDAVRSSGTSPAIFAFAKMWDSFFELTHSDALNSDETQQLFDAQVRASVYVFLKPHASPLLPSVLRLLYGGVCVV